MKPDLSHHYNEGDANVDTYITNLGDRFYYDNYVVPFDERTLTFPDNRFEIYAYAAESRTFAIGTDPVFGFGMFNLRSAPLSYNDAHYCHSRQFRSNIVDEKPYWAQVMADCGFNQ